MDRGRRFCQTARTICVASTIGEKPHEAVHNRCDLGGDNAAIVEAERRTGHLPQLLLDGIARLRLDAGSKTPISAAAGHHADLRRKQGYTVASAIDESRLLQVSIFSMLHRNLKHLEVSTLLPDVARIADEVDAQLKQLMLQFTAV